MTFEMNMLWAALLLPMGLAILIKGAGLLVDGAVALAEKLGISPLVIGLTIVAMGTSAPEVAASIAAAARDLGDTAIGNVYGSNIANLALVGGLCAIIRPIKVRANVIKREMPVMLAVALLLWPILALDSYLDREESIILLIIFTALIVFTVLGALRRPEEATAQPAKTGKTISISASVVYVLLGLAGLAVGADFTVRSAVFIGRAAGLSEAVIGLTIVAIGTSLPELMTCVVAAFKGHDDLSIGNLVGSNIFNTLLVVGVAGTISPFGVNARLAGPDYWIMITVSAVFVLIAAVTKRIGRKPGIILLAAYLAYMVYLFVLTPGM